MQSYFSHKGLCSINFPTKSNEQSVFFYRHYQVEANVGFRKISAYLLLFAHPKFNSRILKI